MRSSGRRRTWRRRRGRGRRWPSRGRSRSRPRASWTPLARRDHPVQAPSPTDRDLDVTAFPALDADPRLGVVGAPQDLVTERVAGMDVDVAGDALDRRGAYLATGVGASVPARA